MPLQRINRQFGASPFDLLSGGVSQQLTNALPTQGQVIQAYMGAIVAFWIVGGITLYLVSKSRR